MHREQGVHTYTHNLYLLSLSLSVTHTHLSSLSLSLSLSPSLSLSHTHTHRGYALSSERDLALFCRSLSLSLSLFLSLYFSLSPSLYFSPSLPFTHSLTHSSCIHLSIDIFFLAETFAPYRKKFNSEPCLYQVNTGAPGPAVALRGGAAAPARAALPAAPRRPLRHRQARPPRPARRPHPLRRALRVAPRGAPRARTFANLREPFRSFAKLLGQAAEGPSDPFMHRLCKRIRRRYKIVRIIHHI
jgi:hypothetical protein